MKKTLQLVGITFLANLSYAQQGFVVTGLNLQSSDGSSRSSIGQVNYSNLQNVNGSINEGIQQPKELFQFSNISENDVTSSVTMFPNPASSQLHFQFNETNLEPLSIEIFDATGKSVLKQNAHQSTAIIDIHFLATGLYSVKVKGTSFNQSIIKLIKH